MKKFSLSSDKKFPKHQPLSQAFNWGNAVLNCLIWFLHQLWTTDSLVLHGPLVVRQRFFPNQLLNNCRQPLLFSNPGIFSLSLLPPPPPPNPPGPLHCLLNQTEVGLAPFCLFPSPTYCCFSWDRADTDETAQWTNSERQSGGKKQTWGSRGRLVLKSQLSEGSHCILKHWCGQRERSHGQLASRAYGRQVEVKKGGPWQLKV